MKNTVFSLLFGALLLLGPTSFRRAPFPPVTFSGSSAELPWAPGDFDDGSQVDLLVVYTQSAVNEHGSEQKMKEYVAAEVTKLNNAFNSSGIDLEVNLVYQQLLSPYTEGEYGTDLANLQGNTTVAALRDDYHADIVVMMRNNAATIDKLAGKAQGMFAVTKNKNNHTFCHEVGHIFGAMHNDDACTNGCRAFLSGLQKCVMAGGIFAFSTPNITLSGVPYGSSTANATQIITNNKASISQQRGSSVKWTGSVSTDWNTAGNWTYLKGAAKTPTAMVPRATDDVLIPSGASRYPVINGNAAMRSITTQAGTSLTIQTGTVDVYGNWYGNGSLTCNGGTVNFRSPNAKGATVQQATGGFKAVAVKPGTLVKVASNLSVPGGLTVEKRGALAQNGKTITPAPVDQNAAGDVFLNENCDNGAAASTGQTAFEMPGGWAALNNTLPKESSVNAGSYKDNLNNKWYRMYVGFTPGVVTSNATVESWIYSAPLKLQKGSYKVSLNYQGDGYDVFNCQVYLGTRQLPAFMNQSVGQKAVTGNSQTMEVTFTVAESGMYYLGITNKLSGNIPNDGYAKNELYIDDIKLTRQ
mgnify:CR=1 FL=1